jgi:hypothetical protein
MADVTISELTQGTPNNNALLPYSQGGNTLCVAPSSLLSNAGNISVGNNIGDTLQYLDVTNLNSGNDAGANLRLVTRNAAGTANIAVDITKYKTGALTISNGEPSAAGFISFNVGPLERMRINSNGYVTKPYQPGFKATITSQSQSTGQTILWDTVEYDVPAGSFNTTTGEWTVPQSGRYIVIVNLLSQRNTAGGDWYVDLYVNSGQPYGGRMYTSKAGNSNVHAQLNASGIFYLNTGDKIKTVLTSQVGNVNPTILHNLFCAELLG